ncbi:MAG: tRNA (adenosine(37)-N6)-threonylcarbamoyltransferase complex dimerization subunit type 1 TsaB [Bacteroides sp.]|nr:tRNA (adenosine(37)-N6)-threonylcarbamoyltransferase complex dimerization subunit type 1 TsaB [Bacteroides sp.]MCM1086221.1 tRNA (adenosine(37)-N6)-threonylcarbamoyltransferase complex dimerization subunit type 1 TsaB [Bacteroides sp.]
MAIILNIETSTRNCSVALSKNGQTIAWRETDQGNEHAARIAVFVQEVLEEAGLKAQEIDAVAIGEGPGSYTGLRIGVSTAKGLAYSLDKPLIRVSPLQAMAVACAGGLKSEGQLPAGALFCPMTDAGRMEVYTAIYNAAGEPVRPVEARIIDGESFSEYLPQHTLFFCGDGCAKCQSLFEGEAKAVFHTQIKPGARHMPPLAEQAFAQGKFEDVAYFEPFYLKDFVAGKPHVKGLA